MFTFELYGLVQMFRGPLFQIKPHLLSTVLLLGSFEIHWVRQYLVNFTGLVGIANVTAYKTEPLFTGLRHGLIVLIFSCDQAALWMVQSVRLSVCPSVRLSVCLSHLFDYVPIILSSWNFQELLPVTKVTSMQKVKVRGQRSRSQRSQPNFTVSGL